MKNKTDEKLIDTVQSIFNDKWKLKILWFLLDGKKRFKDINKILTSSEKTLTLKLKELENKSLITRECFCEVPPRVEYALSEISIELKPILLNLIKWSDNYTKEVCKKNEI